MPHVIYKGMAKMAELQPRLFRQTIQQEGWIIRFLDAYLSSEARVLLVETTAVRSGFSQNFYLRVEQKGENVTVRVDPMMRIERNEGVQRSVAAVAKVVEEVTRLPFDKSNLPERIQAWLKSGE